MSGLHRPEVVAVVGATATGKSDLALDLAEELGGEVVNADAMQLYRGMDIGTNKLPPDERRGIPHNLLDVLDVTDEATLADLEFAWRACRSVKSNAILLASDGASVGVGMGQVNRVDSAHLAVTRAGDRAAGSVGVSDAFFPFADGFEVLAKAGVKAVVQPGGSIRDNEVIEAAQAAGITMYLTGCRHFAH